MKNFLGLMLVVCLVPLVGCGSSLGTTPVSGKVMLDGSPIEGAMVIYKPTDPSGRTASGTTDASGVYKLTTEVNGDGALPGKYQVTVTKYEGQDLGIPEEVDPDSEASLDAVYGALDKQGADAGKAESLIAERFGKAETSGLEAEVKKGDANEHNFEVSAK